MKTRILISLVASLTLTTVAASSAQAALIAGWDHSQYAGDGSLLVDFTGVNSDTLAANYSSLDPTFGAGAESASYGTLYFNGMFGSTDVNEAAFPPAFAPSAALGGSLASNLNAPVDFGGPIPFDSLTTLQSEGQLFQSLLAMTATEALQVVYEADLTSFGQIGTDWELTLGGRTNSGTSNVTVEFSTDGGVSYTQISTLMLSDVDTPFSVSLGADALDRATVRLGFDPVDGQPFIDNVAIGATVAMVPEPGLSLLGLALAAASLRRRR